MLRGLALFAVCMLWLHARGLGQEAVADLKGNTVAYRMFVKPSGPCVVIFPQGLRPERDLFIVARKFNHIGANAVVVPPETIYSDPWASADTLLSVMRRAVDIAAKEGGGPIIVVAEQKMASMALIAGTTDFRIKGVVAISPGEYFADRAYVHKHIDKLRIPTIVLFSPAEERVVKSLLSDVPVHYIIYSGVLRHMGYKDLLGASKVAGQAWLALSLFYNENFLPDREE